MNTMAHAMRNANIISDKELKRVEEQAKIRDERKKRYAYKQRMEKIEMDNQGKLDTKQLEQVVTAAMNIIPKPLAIAVADHNKKHPKTIPTGVFAAWALAAPAEVNKINSIEWQSKAYSIWALFLNSYAEAIAQKLDRDHPETQLSLDEAIKDHVKNKRIEDGKVDA